jgi:hypothetical protein
MQRSPRLWLAVLGVAVLAAVAGLVGREIYRQPPPDLSGGQAAVVVAPTNSPTPVDKQPGPREVMLTQDAADHSQYQVIRQVLQDHFDAINSRSYTKWRTTVTKAKADQMAEPEWKQNYRSTADGSILLYRIEAAPDKKLRVLVGFTSIQDVADAPAELPKTCIVWHVVLPLAKEDNKWRIDAGREGASPQHEECGTSAS